MELRRTVIIYKRSKSAYPGAS